MFGPRHGLIFKVVFLDDYKLDSYHCCNIKSLSLKVEDSGDETLN